MQPAEDRLERRRRLIQLAEQVARAPLPAPRPPVGLVAGLATVGVMSIGAGVKFAMNSEPGRATVVSATSVVPTAAPASESPVGSDAEVVAMAPVPPTSTPPGVEVALPDQPVRWAVLADGILHLRGQVPDLQAAQQVYSRAADAVGASAVVVEFSVVPGAALPVDDPVHVPEVARFQPGSTALLPASLDAIRGVLDGSASRAALTIEVHPDPLADDAALDAGRADVVRRLLIELGLDPARVTVAQPSAFGAAVVEDVPDAMSITVYGWFG